MLEGIRSFGLLMCTKLAPCNTLRQIHWQWAEWQSDPFYRRWLMFGARSFFSLSLSSIRFTRVRIAINWNNKLYWISCVSVVLQVHCTDKLAFFTRWFGVQNHQPRPTVILKSKLHKLHIEKHSVNGRKQTCVQTMNWEFNTDAAKKCIGMELVTAARVYFILIRCTGAYQCQTIRRISSRKVPHATNKYDAMMEILICFHISLVKS